MSHSLPRRRFLQATAAAGLAPAPAAERRWNILFVIADQHIARCMHNEGHPQAITPNLDRLAAQGVKFTHHYSQNPICTPSRMSIFTGQYPHNHGYYGLAGHTPPVPLVSFLLHCKRHGYKTAAIGKIHTPDQPTDWIAGQTDLVSEFHQYARYMQAAGLSSKEDNNRLPEFPGRQQNEARPSNLAFKDSFEGWSAAEAIRFIDSCQDQPFCMQLSLPKPHECYTPAREFWDMYPADLALPSTFRNSPAGRPPHFQAMVERLRKQQWLIEPKTYEDGCRRVWRGYLACITHTDHAVGLLLDHLEKTGKAQNTIVIYTADHGAYEGNFGVAEKAPGICSEMVCRVPSLWRVPGVTPAGHVSGRLVESVDIAPTIAALCGLPAMDAVDGRDLGALLRGGDDAVRDVAVTENVWSKSLRWGPWRMVHYQPEMFGGQDIGELYNIDQDPDETRNLYHAPESRETVHQGRRLLLEWLIRTTRYRTLLPPPPAAGQSTVAEDGTESNKYGVSLRVKGHALNYL